MKARPTHYARAFLESLEAGTSYVAAKDNLLRILARNGDRHRLPQVVHEVEKIEVIKRGGTMVTLAFARIPNDAAHTTMLDQFTERDSVVTQIRPELVAGTRIILNDELELDLSLAGKMRTLFQ